MARKAERKAQQKAVDAYMKEWKKLKRIDGIQERKLGTRTKREVEDQLGDNASYESKRLAMKADKAGKVLNKLQPQFKEDADAYNRRYDEFQRQMNNQPVSKEFLNEKKQAAQAEYESMKSAREAADRERNDSPFGRMRNMPTETSITKLATNSQPRLGMMGFSIPSQQENEARSMANNAEAFYGPATSWRKTLPAHEQAAKDFNQLGNKVAGNKQYQQTVTSWRKTLPAHEQAAKDFNQLGNKVAGNKQYQQTAAEYKELADRLKNRLRRDVPVKAPQGLLAQSGEVMGANSNPIASETLR